MSPNPSLEIDLIVKLMTMSMIYTCALHSITNITCSWYTSEYHTISCKLSWYHWYSVDQPVYIAQCCNCTSKPANLWMLTRKPQADHFKITINGWLLQTMFSVQTSNLYQSHDLVGEVSRWLPAKDIIDTPMIILSTLFSRLIWRLYLWWNKPILNM